MLQVKFQNPLTIKISILSLIFLLLPLQTFSAENHSHLSRYAGEESREIKTLSASDIEELSNGSGWGFAKAAELNGVPGPVHMLEMKTEIGLGAKQVQELENLYEWMKKEAIPLGLKFIELERELNNRFADNSMTHELLDDLLEKIADVRKQLRYVHLQAHLKAAEIVSRDQIESYNQLRGYTPDNPCENIPEGHDPKMWRKHHNCPH